MVFDAPRLFLFILCLNQVFQFSYDILSTDTVSLFFSYHILMFSYGFLWLANHCPFIFSNIPLFLLPSSLLLILLH
jgi:hypothetical protein